MSLQPDSPRIAQAAAAGTRIARLALPALLLGSPAEAGELVVVSHDDTVIRRSCRVRIADEPIPDLDGDGVVHVVGDGIVVDFEGSLLRGASTTQRPDTLRGVGIRVEGTKVSVLGARVSGYRVGILAEGTDELLLDGCDVSDNFRQKLSSTPTAEDPGDWLRPHENDGGEWTRSYGAGICVRASREATVRNCTARRVQNGLVLDRVEGSRVYDNDFSFLSGWGLAMWRSSGNVVSRNAFDFCVRGYSHGVYNRGQDSAGILLFEQCSGNVFAENSATHGGDGFFGFAGREALGEAEPPEEGFDYTGRGNNENLIVDNDFSYAAAHGIELTFSFGNLMARNRLVENAICGIWAGYSRDTLIAENRLERNGQAGYGLERGGVNIEHGRANTIVANAFVENACGVHLFDDEDEALAALPWALANGVDSGENVVAGNTFQGDEIALQLRGARGTRVGANEMRAVGVEVDAAPGCEPVPLEAPPPWELPEHDVFGRSRPVGARAELRGRDRIVLTEWGPHDGRTPELLFASPAPGRHGWRLLGAEEPESVHADGDVSAAWEDGRIVVWPERTGAVLPYRLAVQTGDALLSIERVLVDARWRVRFFAFETDPREDAAAWRAEARSPGAVEVLLPALDLRFGSGGPADLADAPQELRAAGLPADRFGVLAETELRIPAGRFRIKVLSDDGVRVWVDDLPVIDEWTWHPPELARAEIVQERAARVPIRLEYFELDGNAVLTLEFEAAAE